MKLAGDIIISIGILFMISGIIGFIRFKHFYPRILITAKIDTVGAITIILGAAIKHGFSFFSLKTLLIMIIMMIINPLASHMIVRAARQSGFQTVNEDDQ